VSPSPNERPLVAIPEPTLRRLPYYHRHLMEMRGQDREFVSCTTLAEELHLNPIQVRKDLQATGAVGRPKVGYHLESTVEAIEECLGYRNNRDVFLVGAGHLGLSLMAYQGFAPAGLRIVAAFDTDRRKIGTEFAGIPIMDLARLPDLTQRMHIQIGILAVPAGAAQEVADLMVGAGVRAIWNFAPTRLALPADVRVRHENLLASLSVLSVQLQHPGKTPDKEPPHGEPEEL